MLANLGLNGVQDFCKDRVMKIQDQHPDGPTAIGRQASRSGVGSIPQLLRRT
jgi:hypothetical protein